MATQTIIRKEIKSDVRGLLFVEVQLDAGSIWHVKDKEWKQVCPSDIELLKTFPTKVKDIKEKRRVE